MKRTSFFIGFFALVFQSLNASATAPHFEWEILYTPHFEVIYHKPQKELAKHYAFAAEESYRQLSAVFSDLPETTVLVLDDSTDLTNGSATFLPYNWINIYPALPAEGDSLDHYGYWPTAIMIHEMTHIANFQPVNGVFTPLSWLFGRVIAPNILLPRWYLEGLAVDVESRYTSHGRLRSPRTQGILRALAEENAFDEFSIDRINEVRIPTWPFGERPYFFGSLLQKSLVDQGSDDMRERWNQRYGRRMPFFINAVPQDEFGKGFVHLLGDVYAELKTKAKSQVESIQSEGSSDRTAFKEVDHEQHSPVIDSSGTQLIYISKSDQRSGIYRIQKTKAAPDFSKNDPELLFYAGYPQRLVWNNQGTGFYFDELNLDTPFVAYRQILYFDLNTMEKHLVSPENLRLQDPALNPSGDQLVAILTKENGRQVLAALSLKDHSVKELYQAPLEERLSSPNYLNSEQIVFVKKNLRGEEQILVSSFKDLKVSKLPQSFFDLYSVRAYGNALSFISSKNGVPNIYLLSLKDPSASPKALTNTTSLVHSFAPSNEKTWVTSEMTSKGRKLFLRPLRSLKDPALKSQPPVVAYKDSPKEKIPTQKELDEVVQDEGSFYPFKYLLPRYWIPFVYPVE
ncbi:MAG TPA: hypothetical protein DCL41_08210, partial [Bdellovibrionales bacterium]|nr:hypothetical protein [Bdellovibrionales bacterium]